MSRSRDTTVRRRSLVVDGLGTSYLEAGHGEPVVLLHGGEFGGGADVGWEHTISALAQRYWVLAPDLLGFGHTAKVVDFVDGRGMRLRHLARFCALLGVESARFIGNSMGAVMLLADATSDRPRLPASRMALICGGGRIQAGPAADALFDYDATVDGMRRIVAALFHDPSFPRDEDYVRRRFESSVAPGAWEAVAAARFRRPGAEPAGAGGHGWAVERITVPVLLVEGGADKLLPSGWASELAGRMPDADHAVVSGAGHCPQIERADEVNGLLTDFLPT